MSPRILQLGKFYPPDVGGIERVMQDICDGINARGLVCDVLCSSSSYRFGYEILDSGARIYRTKSFGKLASTSITPQMVFELNKLIQAYDIIHLHLPDPMANLALFLSDIQGKLIILHWHSDIIKQKHLLKLYAPLQSWLLQKAHSIIATSPKYIAESAFLRPYIHKSISIPIGIDSAAPFSKSNREPKRLFALGRLVPYKGFEYAIEAMQYLPEYHLYIGGGGVLYDKLQAQIKRLHVEHRVTLLGFLHTKEIIEHYQRASIFIFPSITKNEAFGIAQIEAMSYGLPVISCSIDGSGVDWVNQNNISGVIVPPQNPQAIANAITTIEKDYQGFSARAQERFATHFLKETMLDSIQALYLQAHDLLIGGGGSTRI